MTIPVSMYQNVVGSIMTDASPTAQAVHGTTLSTEQAVLQVGQPTSSTPGIRVIKPSTVGTPFRPSGVPDAINAVEIMTVDSK